MHDVTDPGERDHTLFRPGPRASVLQLFRAYADAHVEVSRALARNLGVHASDAVAMAEILWAESSGTPLSPARLSERIGITTGTAATMINRLEAAGFVIRSREDSDRRIIRLRLTPDARSRTQAFFTPIGQAVDEALDGYDEAFLSRLEQLMKDMVTATHAHDPAPD